MQGRTDHACCAGGQETGTALGYLALFLNLAAFYLDGPLLHVIGFQVDGLCSYHHSVLARA